MNIMSCFQAAIWHCLNHYAYLDAIFLAERLCAEGKILCFFPFFLKDISTLQLL